MVKAEESWTSDLLRPGAVPQNETSNMAEFSRNFSGILT